MWIIVLILLLLGAHLNLSALVPLKTGDTPPPWWVGGRLVWPFAEDTNTLLPRGDTLNVLTPILAATAALLFLMAAAALLRWAVPAHWFQALIIGAVAASIVLQVMWFSGYAVLPLLINAALLYAVFSSQITVASLRA
jgi:hypothetical protein